ncbi:hypothetical protein OJAV_G00177850 [Oryzias javanicus]|uniref:IBB domain-containing protein n=1 Tax=Oryzias javanicus TaxID=123683 RepID=A0A437CBJ5_ORYJA|nr:hypothetical protein OJAV_G00177850 [Oryzias javanicus]
MAHAAAHIKKARSEMEQPPDLKALEKARERRRRSRERAERRRKVPHYPSTPSHFCVSSQCVAGKCPPSLLLITIIICMDQKSSTAAEFWQRFTSTTVSSISMCS